MFELMDFAIYLMVGSLAGVLAGLLGVGGGLVIVPTLIWIFHGNGFDSTIVVHLAVGTSLATIVVTSISSIRAHHSRGAVLWIHVLQLAPGIVLGAWVGAVIADLLPTLWLQRVFGGFAILVGIQMGIGAKPSPHRELPGRPGMSLAGAVIGAISSVVGIGGGSLTVPFLSWCNVNMRNAVATSAACGLPIAIAGAIGFLVVGWSEAALPVGSSGYIYWPALTGIVVASFFLAPLGARLAHTLPIVTLKRGFALLLLLLGTKMLVS